MQRLTLTEFIFTIIVLIGIAWCAAQLYQSTLINLTESTFARVK